MIAVQDVRDFMQQAQSYQAKSDYPNAERSLLLALEASTEVGHEAALMAEALQLLTSFYSQMDQYSEAIAQASWCIEMVKSKQGAESPDLAPLYSTMADLQRCDGNEDEAARYAALAAKVHA